MFDNMDMYLVKTNEFNKLCENNNETINRFINCICDGAPMKVTVDLKDVLIFSKGTETVMKMCKTERICRLCFEKVKVTNSVCLNEYLAISNIVLALFPEMDLNCTENPVICPECLENVTKQFQFKLKHGEKSFKSKCCKSFFSISQEDENKKNSQEVSLVELNEQFIQNCQKLAKVLQEIDEKPQVL